jgi:phage-related tail protein
MQEQYFILQQAYEELQQNSQDQQAKLVGKLEKGYDAYNEKFTRVEELEEKLNKCNKLHNENQVYCIPSLVTIYI